MRPIQLNKHQTEALTNGATMLWVPIANKYISIQTSDEQFLQSAYSFECSWCKGKDPQCTDCYGTGRQWDIDCEYVHEFIIKYSPLQIGQEYYVQEEFMEECNRLNIEWINIYYRLSKPSFVTDVDECWNNASKMQEHQSRLKFKVTDVQVKRKDDVVVDEFTKMGYLNSDTKAMTIMRQFNKDHNLTIEYNQCGFLVTIERID